jgi:Mycoplasma MFS transporter
MRVPAIVPPVSARPVATAPPTSLAWPAISVYAGIGLYMVSPHRDEYLGAAVSIIAFGLVPLVLHRVRPLRLTPICPLNWTLFAFFLQLVVVPLLVCFFGPAQSTLPALPSQGAINIALLISSLAFAAFGIGYHVMAGRSRASASEARPRSWPSSSPALVAFYLGLGVLGLVLTFHNLDSILGYFGNATSAAPLTLEKNSVSKVAGIFLRAFLGFACVIAWCGWIDRGRRRSPTAVIGATALAAGAILISYGTFAYNRGSFVAPIVALLAVYGTRVRRLNLRWLVVLGVVGALLLTAFRVYRASDVTLGQVVANREQRDKIAKKTSVNKELQLYAGAPQFTGYLLAKTDYASYLRYGKTLISSAMSPVPTLGRSFRSSSGTEIYNRLIYGSAEINDQVIPFQGELFINFHLPGVIIGYLLLGLVMQHLQRGFERAPTSLQAFSWQYAATWTAYLVAGSVAVLSQIFIYFFWPIYALALWTRLRPAEQGIPRPSRPEATGRSQLAGT